jgi:hypothetical protein
VRNIFADPFNRRVVFSCEILRKYISIPSTCAIVAIVARCWTNIKLQRTDSYCLYPDCRFQIFWLGGIFKPETSLSISANRPTITDEFTIATYPPSSICRPSHFHRLNYQQSKTRSKDQKIRKQTTLPNCTTGVCGFLGCKFGYDTQITVNIILAVFAWSRNYPK